LAKNPPTLIINSSVEHCFWDSDSREREDLGYLKLPNFTLLPVDGSQPLGMFFWTPVNNGRFQIATTSTWWSFSRISGLPSTSVFPG